MNDVTVKVEEDFDAVDMEDEDLFLDEEMAGGGIVGDEMDSELALEALMAQIDEDALLAEQEVKNKKKRPRNEEVATESDLVKQVLGAPKLGNLAGLEKIQTVSPIHELIHVSPADKREMAMRFNRALLTDPALVVEVQNSERVVQSLGPQLAADIVQEEDRRAIQVQQEINLMGAIHSYPDSLFPPAAQPNPFPLNRDEELNFVEGGLRPRRLLPGETRVNLSRDKALDLIRRYESGEGLSVEQRNLLMLYPPLEALESRKGPSNVNLYYLSNSAAIRLANEVFGPDGWSSSIIASNPPMIEFDKGKYKVTAIVHVRAQLRVSGTIHDGIGIHTSVDSKKETALENAIKSAHSDGIRRALRMFGNYLGNALWTKTFVNTLRPGPNNTVVKK